MDDGDETERAEAVEAAEGAGGEPERQRGLLGSIFGAFNKTFWVVNAFELFERGAYYGTMAVLAVHVVNNLGIDRDTWGALYSFLIIMLYFVPLFSAALADKLGYKVMLAVAFTLMLVGYSALSLVQPGELTFLVGAFFIVGLGAGMFKPIISASIAHVTPEERRNLAYSIYYWMINLGAVIFPFVIWAFFPDIALYYYVFLVSTGLVMVNMAILFLMFRNPVEPQPDLPVTGAIKRIIPALQDRWFVVLLIIYSGFWFMFAYNHTFLPNYLVDFGRMPVWFTAPLLATVNPGTIVILGPYLGKLVERFKSLNVMMVGMVIFCIGFALNGMSRSQSLFVLGIVVFSIGEFIVHPGFISYVSKIAPKDKVAIYLACIFLSTGLGQVFGGFVQGQWYQVYAYEQGRPPVYIALVICVGLITLLAFIWYNRRQIRETLRVDPTAQVDTGIWTKPITMVVVVLFIPVTIWGGYAAGPMEYVGERPDGPVGPDWPNYTVVSDSLPSDSGYANELTTTPLTFTVDVANVRSVTFTLTWTDEPGFSIRHTNQADEFGLEVLPPNNTDASGGPSQNPIGGQGSISVTVDYEATGNDDPYYNGTGDYQVSINCNECGDHELWRPSIGLQDQPDDGNEWNLDISYEYYQRPSG